MATLDEKQAEMRELRAKRGEKSRLYNRSQVRQRWSRILSNPDLSDEEWKLGIKEALRHFPEWSKERRRRAQNKSEIEVDDLVQMMEKAER